MKNANASRLVHLGNKGERKMRQDMHKPMVVPDKKKEQSRMACRSSLKD